MSDDKVVPAFPVVAGSDVLWNGMTLRDWFAGQASESDVLRYRRPVYKSVKERGWWGLEYEVFDRYEYTSEQARYRYADAMMEARK